MDKIQILIQSEIGNITEEEMTRVKRLVDEYGANDFIRALVKSSYNNMKDLNIVERILKEELFQEAQVNIDEILSATDTEYTKVVEEAFERELSQVEKYLLNKACSKYNIEELNHVLNDERLKGKHTIHHIEDLLKIN